jgi:uncharacterized protein YciI
VELERYSFVLLRRPDDAPELPQTELEALQEAHLAHLAELGRQGVLAAAGPFADQEDESWRGFCLYRAGLEETRALAEADPSVRAGRLAVDVLTWWTLPGSIVQPDGG